MLEVATGLIFVYLLFSLICSALSEIVAWATDLRARTLRAGVETLLADEKLRRALEEKGLLKQSAAARGVLPRLTRPAPPDVASTIYEHPLIRGLMQGKALPSYIPKENFSAAFLDLLRQVAPAGQGAGGGDEALAKLRGTIDNLPDGDIKQSLQAVLDETVTSMEQAKARVEKWFDDAMERVSGWYKRRAQWVVLFLSAALVTAANADSVMIAQSLSRDPVLRQSLVAAAEQTARQGRPEQWGEPDVQDALRRLNEVEARLNDLRLPIGWRLDPQAAGEPRLEDLRVMPTGWSGWLAKLGGLLFTIFAVSLGAPFWFDVLNKVVNVRITGRQPEPALARTDRGGRS